MVISRYGLARFLDLAQYHDAEIARILGGLGFETEIITPPQLSDLDYGIILSVPPTPTSEVYQVAIGQQQQSKKITIHPPQLAVGTMVLVNTGLPTPTCYTYQDLGISTSTHVWQLSHAQQVLLMSDLQQQFNANSFWQDTFFNVDIPPHRVDCYGGLFLLQELAAFIGQKFNILDYGADQELFSAKNSQNIPKAPYLAQQSSISVPSQFWLLKNQPQCFTLRDFITLQRCQVPVLPTFYSVMQWQLVLATGLPLIFFNYQALSDQLVLTDRYQYAPDQKKKTIPVGALMDGTRLVYLLGEEHITTGYQVNDQNCPGIGILCLLMPPAQMRQQKKNLNQHHWGMNRGLQPVSPFAVGILAHYVQQQWSRQQLITFQQNHHAGNTNPRTIKIDGAVISTHLGTTIPGKQLEEGFKRLNFIFVSGRLSSARLLLDQKSELCRVRAPLYRTDVTWQEHVIQEITRGMLTSNCFTDAQLQPLRAELPLVSVDRVNTIAHRIEQLLHNTGGQRVYGYYLTTGEQARRFNGEQHLLYQVQQSLQKQYVVFANSLLPQLLTIAQNNLYLLNQNRFFAKATLPGANLQMPDSAYIALGQSDYYSSYQSPKVYYEKGFGNLKKIGQQICGLVGVNPGHYYGKSIAIDSTNYKFSFLGTTNEFMGYFRVSQQDYRLDPALTYLICYCDVPVAYIGGLKQLLHRDRLEVVFHYFLEINLQQLLKKLPPKLTFDQHSLNSSNLITRHLNYYSSKSENYRQVKAMIQKVSPTCRIQIQDRYLVPWDKLPKSLSKPQSPRMNYYFRGIKEIGRSFSTAQGWKITLNLQFFSGSDQSPLTNTDVNQMVQTIHQKLISTGIIPDDQGHNS